MNPETVVFFLVIIASIALYYVTIAIAKKLINREEAKLHIFIGAVLFASVIANSIRLCWN